MSAIREDVRVLIRRLYFTEKLSLDDIAERLGFSIKTVRRALVINGDAPTVPEPGPYRQEDES